MTIHPRAADTLVIGGGLVGAAVAWGLASRGETVTVLDEGDQALRASRGNFGLVWVQSKGDGMHDYARWTRSSADIWPEFSECLKEDTGISTDYHQPGGMHLCLSEQELEKSRALSNRMHNVNGALGYGSEILDRKQVADMLPEIGPEVVGGSFGRHDGHASPLKLLMGLHAGIKARGSKYVSGAGVDRIERDGDGYSVTTAKGVYRAGKLVLAAGHGNHALGPLVGLDIPLRPEKGQILVTERVAPFLSMPTHVVRQTEEGSLLMGDSHEDTGFSTLSTTPVMSQIASRAARFFPLLKNLRVIRSWGAVRVLSPDGYPIYQQSETHPGVFSVNCHSGVTLAGAHAMLLAPMISAGQLAPEFDVFSARRFHGQTH